MERVTRKIVQYLEDMEKKGSNPSLRIIGKSLNLAKAGLKDNVWKQIVDITEA